MYVTSSTHHIYLKFRQKIWIFEQKQFFLDNLVP